MGQNDSKEIESTVSHLQSQKHISHSQAQKFLHDYHTNDQSVKDVRDFDNNRLKLFLKYFINHKYRATQTLLTKRTKTNQSANNNENNYDQLMGTLCFETQKIEEKMVRCHQDINSFILYERLEMFQQMIKSTLAEIGISEMIMRVKSNEKSLKITYKRPQNILCIQQDNGKSLSSLLSHKYRFRKVSKQDLIKEKFFLCDQQIINSEFFVEELITREKSILLILSFAELNSITEQNSQIFTKVQKLSSTIGDFLDQIMNSFEFYTHPEIGSNNASENKNHVAEICWNVLKMYKNYFDFQHAYFVNKLLSEYKNLLHLTSNDYSLKNIKSKVQQLFSKNNNCKETATQVLKSFQQYQKRYLLIKNNLSDYLQRYFRAINEEMLQFQFDLNTELKVLVSSGQSKKNQFLFDQIREIVEKQAMPTLLDVFKDHNSFKQFYKDSYHQALKNTKNHSVFQQDGISLQFSFKDQILQSIRIAVSLEALSKQANNQNELVINRRYVSDLSKKSHHFLSIQSQNEKQNISQLSSTFNIKIQSKPGSPKNISILDLTMNEQSFDPIFDIFDPDLNILNIPKQTHLSLALKIMENVEFYRVNLQKNQFKFMNFLSNLKIGYLEHKNPFHNFTHGVNVMHTAFLLISMKEVNQKLSQFSQFALVLSALCHDVGHTGFNNAFEIATQSSLAQTYNDVSPLENYHIHRTFKILKDSSCNFIESIDNSQKTQFRKFLISNILNTDVKEHFNVLKKFEEKKNQFKKGDFQDQKIISGMLIHSSDFAGSIKEFSVCYTWSQMVNEQFKNQSRQQQKLKIPLSPFMMNLDNPLVLAKNEMGFLKFMVQPLYKSIAQTFLSQNAKKMYARVNDNIIEWQNIIKSLNG